MKHSIGLMAAAAVLTLAACGGQDENSGGLSAEENQKLDNMAETMDASADSLVATDETGLGNGEEANAGTGEDANAATGDVMVSDDAPANEQ